MNAPNVCPVPGCPNAQPCEAHPARLWSGSTWAWRKVRRAALQRDRGRCYCGARATAVHHVVALIDGGTDELANLRSVCNRHHGAAHPGRQK